MSDIEIKRTAGLVYRRKLIARIVAVIMVLIMFALFAVFISGSVAENSGVFQIQTHNKGNSSSSSSSQAVPMISLSNTQDFLEPTTVIKGEPVPAMNNISQLKDIPSNIDNEMDGSHNGQNYFAHTFYLKNSGDGSGDIVIDFNILATFRGAEKAMWVRFYHNGVLTTYAKANADGEPEYGTIPFFSEDKVMIDRIEDVQPGQVEKFTIVIWLEGDDPDCTDEIKGGFVRFSLDFTVDINEGNA